MLMILKAIVFDLLEIYVREICSWLTPFQYHIRCPFFIIQVPLFLISKFHDIFPFLSGEVPDLLIE